MFAKCYVLFLFLQAKQGQKIAQQASFIAKQEKEMTEARMSVMLSQMQPHFLYNALNSIYVLCGVDAKLAQNTINGFSNYLSGNLDSIKRTVPDRKSCL